MNYEKIIVRIQKLLDLSRNAGSDEEAASAAARAAEMMREYEIQEAELSLLDSTHKTEAIVDEVLKSTESRRRVVTWQDTITHGVVASLGAHMYWRGPRVYLWGRVSVIQAANYMVSYLQREVEELADREWAAEAGERDGLGGVSSRAWKNAFRVGCAGVIASRLHEKAREDKTERVQRRAEAAAANVNPQALAVVARDREEVDQAFRKRMKGSRSKRMGGQVSSADGYSAGRRAGQSVSLGGGRGALGQGQGRLR